jgi:2Fe-2S ferredoxin
MPKVTYLRPSGESVVVDATEGMSVMQTAVANGITEVVAECGGTLACATCHVYVQDEFLAVLPEVSEDEAEMLDYTAAERLPGSRLSCQLPVTTDLDGLVVRCPETQY